jgi:hypothetical protein
MSAVQSERVSAVVFTSLVLVIVGCVTALIWLAADGRSVLRVFPFSAGAWGAYLCAHYVVEGEFVDDSEAGDADANETTDTGSVVDADATATGAASDGGGRTTGEDSGGRLPVGLAPLPSSRTRRAFAVGGVTGMLLTFPTGILAVGGGDPALMVVSATLFVGGYVVGHQGFTGKPL